MRVALIDGAVNMDFLKNTRNTYVRVSGRYAVRCGEVTEEQKDARKMTHASVCAGIFMSEVTCPCELLLIRALDEDSLRGNVHALVTALEFCMSSRVDVISLSLGTSRIRDAGVLRDTVNELLRRHVVIVAAESNRNLLTFPAAFEHVIGVRELTPANRKIPSDGILYRSTKRSFLYQGGSVMTGSYNSYAAPAVAATVCGCLARGITETENIRQELLCQKNVRKSKNAKRMKAGKPVIFLDIKEKETAFCEVIKIMRFFDGDGYEGVCLSDTLRSDYCAGVLNLSQFQRIVSDAGRRLDLLTNMVDSDFVIWHVTRTSIDKRRGRSIDMTVTNDVGHGYRLKADWLAAPLDEEKLCLMRKHFT